MSSFKFWLTNTLSFRLFTNPAKQIRYFIVLLTCLYPPFSGPCAIAAGLEIVHAVDEEKKDLFHNFPPRDIFNKFVKMKYVNQTNYEPYQMNEVSTNIPLPPLT